ncbi:hypothetical protein C806_00309 [Lachnospiraceae bacterium 3-1]|nr:hypothetical protein C806_00309 [Lachnospiraceae bacterium 3-1]
MKNKKVGIFLLLLIIICQTAGCASSGNGQMKYNKKEDYWTDDREIETDVEIADLDTDMKSTIEGDWYVFDSVKRNGDDIKKITFKNNICYGEGINEYNEEIAYEYDEENQILTFDYSKIFEETEEVVQSYAPVYDDIMFLYSEYFVPEGVNTYLEYENPNFPNSVLLLERNGKYYTLDGVLCRKAEFPNVKSMSLALGAETIEDCLCNYYANWVGALSIGFLEQVYGIYDGDIITVQQEIEEAELDFSRVDYENLSIENIVDVSIEDVVWDFYSDCPLEEVKYVTYSHDTDTGIQTSAVYMGKTYGLWSILWTSGEIN